MLLFSLQAENQQLQNLAAMAKQRRTSVSDQVRLAVDKYVIATIENLGDKKFEFEVELLKPITESSDLKPSVDDTGNLEQPQLTTVSFEKRRLEELRALAVVLDLLSIPAMIHDAIQEWIIVSGIQEGLAFVDKLRAQAVDEEIEKFLDEHQ